MKLAIIGALAAQASAYTLQNGVQGEGMTQANEYSIRNIDEICVSTRPARMCSEGYVVEKTKNEKFDFHCTSRNSIEGQKWQQRVENNEVISEMAGKTTHVQGRVQVPTKCVEQNQVSSHEVRRRKHQQQHGLRVELIENDQQEFEIKKANGIKLKLMNILQMNNTVNTDKTDQTKNVNGNKCKKYLINIQS